MIKSETEMYWEMVAWFFNRLCCITIVDINRFRKSFFFIWVMEQKPDILLEGHKGCIKECEEFVYSGVKIDKEDIQDNFIKNSIFKGRAITAMMCCRTGK